MNYVILEKAIQTGHKAYTRTVKGKLQQIKLRGFVKKKLKPKKRERTQVAPKREVREKPKPKVRERSRQEVESKPKGDYSHKLSSVKQESKKIVSHLSGTMKLFKQSEGMCGPASVRIALSKFGKSFSEEEIAKLAKTTAQEGTGHDNLVKALNKSGVHALQYQDLSESHALEVLREHTKKGDPVIIDWMKTKLLEGGDVKASEGMKPGEETGKTEKDIKQEENEHYSVVSKVDDKNVTLLDPLESKEEKLPIDYFMKRWTNVSEKADRWMVVLTSGKEEKE